MVCKEEDKIMNVFDMPVIGHDGMIEVIHNRIPRTKKKRIVNKWKKYKYSVVPRKDALIFTEGIVCHPSMVKKVEEGIKVARGNNEDS